jgi:arginyl-tRNA--protein-N-Asp/Glu arginylyltransferase
MKNGKTKYLSWDEKIITDLSEKNISDIYSRGYVFTRIGKGVMHQTRSVRIDLAKFELTSENRRILKKANIGLIPINLPLDDYDYTIGKSGKDFYEKKFGTGIMSAQKIKEMLTDTAKSNFNMVLRYSELVAGEIVGHAICYMDKSTLHYSYPFYDLDAAPKDMGLGMMTTAINFAQEQGLKYVYLGSIQRPNDTYKLQFEGLEWFDGTKWQTDIEQAKQVLSTLQTLRTL